MRRKAPKGLMPLPVGTTVFYTDAWTLQFAEQLEKAGILRKTGETTPNGKWPGWKVVKPMPHQGANE